jgi:hypothetical protein
MHDIDQYTAERRDAVAIGAVELVKSANGRPVPFETEAPVEI